MLTFILLIHEYYGVMVVWIKLLSWLLFVMLVVVLFVELGCFFFQAEDGIRDLVRSRGLGDVYKRQLQYQQLISLDRFAEKSVQNLLQSLEKSKHIPYHRCLLYTSDAADDLLCVDLGGRRIIKKKKNLTTTHKILTYTLHQNADITHKFS